jgi:hypothetical protein
MGSLHFNEDLEDKVAVVIQRPSREFESFFDRVEAVVPMGHHVVETW